MTPENIEQLFVVFETVNDEPKIELDYKNPYTLLVAVILSAQSTDKGVNKATKKLFELVDNPKTMVELGEVGLKDYIKTIGLYNNKAKNIISMSKMLIDKFDGNVPLELEDLKSLPGVGQKSANVMRSVLLNDNVIAVDTHVFRVSNRLGLCSTKTPEQTEKALLKIIPHKWLRRAHHWLVLHGRYICKAKKPDCHLCFAKNICMFENKTKP